MERNTPLFVRAILAFLAASALLARLPDPMPRSVRAALEGIRIERDPRRMSARELRQLPGLGPRLSRAVVEARAAHALERDLVWEDVPGIGEVRGREVRSWLRARGIAPDPLAPARANRGASDGRYAAGMSPSPRAMAWSLALLLAGCGPAGRSSSGESAPREEASRVPPSPAPEVHPRALLGGALHALEADPKGEPLVILLHGARYSARTWQDLGTLALLAREGFHALALDWPGFGATPAWDGEPDPAELLGRVLDELEVARVVLVAPSMSGRFAFAFARAEPERLAGLVAVAPADSTDAGGTGQATPTLLLWGERDEVVPLVRGRELAQRLPGARFEILSGASHPCYLDQPERFHALLLEFLRGL